MTTTIKNGKLNLIEIFFKKGNVTQTENFDTIDINIGKDAFDRIEKYFVRNKKRIYINKCYSTDANLILDVHKNGLFYYSECYSLIEKEKIDSGDIYMIKYEKNVQPSDNFPILRDYLYETEKNIIEFLVGEHLVLLCEKDKKYWLMIRTFTEEKLEQLINLLQSLIKRRQGN
jgi:hypothetical protein